MGIRMPTIYDVAKRAEVSIATVSAVLNKTAYVSPELTKRVKQAVEELDYTINQIAHSLQTRFTHTIGMLIPDIGDPDPFYGQVVRGAEDVCRKKDYLLILGHTYNRVEEQSRYLSAYRSRFVDGVLLFQAPGEDSQLNRMIEKKRPLVFVGRVPEGLAVDSVATDIRCGTRIGVAHLIARGHRRIGLITVAKSMSVYDGRVAGWKQALRSHKLPIDNGLVVAADLHVDGGRVSALQLLNTPDRPTALFVDNLVLTTGVLKALQELKLECPRDVQIVSSDDAEWLDVFRPSVSTVIQPGYDVGVKSAELLFKRILHPHRAHQAILLRPELKLRD